MGENSSIATPPPKVGCFGRLLIVNCFKKAQRPGFKPIGNEITSLPPPTLAEPMASSLLISQFQKHYQSLITHFQTSKESSSKKPLPEKRDLISRIKLKSRPGNTSTHCFNLPTFRPYAKSFIWSDDKGQGTRGDFRRGLT